MRKTIQAAAAALLFAGAIAASAQSTPSPAAVAFKIPAQPLNQALNNFAQQANLRIVFDTADAEGVTVPALNATLTPDQALKRLLAPTGLKAEYLDSKTIAIHKETRITETSSLSQSLAMEEGQGVKVSQAMQKVEGAGSAQNKNTQGSPNKDETNTNSDSGRNRESSPGIPEILVKGRRSLNSDIQRTEEDMQPYVVFDREQIERSMASNVEEFLKTRLPMNAVSVTNSQTPVGYQNGLLGNTSSIDLRGLGTNQTLILVNGRRMPNVSGIALDNGDYRQPDINGIPLALIERIEVLPSTASAIYGGGATGGVVNVILKKNHAGIEIRAAYDNTFDTDAARRRMDISAGFSLEGGRTSILVSGSYNDSAQLLVSDRDFARRGRELLLSNDAAVFVTGFSAPVGATPNIRSVSGAELVLDDGTPLGSSYTSVPVGYSGVSSDNGAALVNNGGRYNLDIPNDLTGGLQSLVGGPVGRSATLNIRREFTKSLELYTDLSLFDNESEFDYAGLPAAAGTTIQANMPTNPFRSTISVVFPVSNLSYRNRSTSETTRIGAGGILRLPYQWSIQAEYNWNRSHLVGISTASVLTVDGSRALRDGRLNPIRDLDAHPLDFLPSYLLDTPNTFTGPFDNVLQDAVLRLAGPTVRLPAGVLTLSALVERRKEEAKAGYIDWPSRAVQGGVLTDVTAIDFYPSRSQQVDSAYLEALIPLMRKLELQASVRHDAYETTSIPATEALFLRVDSRNAPKPDVVSGSSTVSSTDYLAGLRYSPLNGVVFRASYGTGFLPPSLSQIAAAINPNGFLDVVDPQRGNVLSTYYPIPMTLGGGPRLRPEQSQSTSLGLILKPSLAPGLRLSVDYTRLKKSDEISYVDFNFVFANESRYPGRITRGPLEEDAPAGYTAGPVVAFDATLFNISRTLLTAVDLQLDYSLNTGDRGDVDIYLMATRALDFERQPLPDSLTMNSVGFSDGPQKWRGNAGGSWKHGGWTVGWNTQYYGSRLLYSTSEVLDAIDYSWKIRQQGSDSTPAEIYHDLFARYRLHDRPVFAGGIFSSMAVMLGIQNVFNTLPPTVATTAVTGGYSYQGDPRLRRYSLSLRASF